MNFRKFLRTFLLTLVKFFGFKIFIRNFQSKGEPRIPSDSVRVSKNLRSNVQDIRYFQTLLLSQGSSKRDLFWSFWFNPKTLFTILKNELNKVQLKTLFWVRGPYPLCLSLSRHKNIISWFCVLFHILNIIMNL